MNKMKIIFSSLALAFAVVTTAGAVAIPAAAQTPEQSACEGSGGTWNGNACTQGNRTVAGTLKNVGNILIFLTGAVSVVMIIIGGLRYTLSNGDQSGINSAKNTILYAVVGVIVSIAAFAIVNLVLTNI